MPITASDATPTSALDAEYRALALAASTGDASASKKLMALEDRIDALARSERRKAAAESESQRVTVLAQEAASQVERQAKEARHAYFLEQRLDVFKEIEKETASLALAVALALKVDAECWALALQLGWNPELRTKSRIGAYISTQLGREGAGLSDMPMVPAGLREPLVPE